MGFQKCAEICKFRDSKIRYEENYYRVTCQMKEHDRRISLIGIKWCVRGVGAVAYAFLTKNECKMEKPRLYENPTHVHSQLELRFFRFAKDKSLV